MVFESRRSSRQAFEAGKLHKKPLIDSKQAVQPPKKSTLTKKQVEKVAPPKGATISKSVNYRGNEKDGPSALQQAFKKPKTVLINSESVAGNPNPHNTVNPTPHQQLSPIINVTIQQPATATPGPTAPAVNDMDAYHRYREVDTKWWQQNATFSHQLFSSDTTSKPLPVAVATAETEHDPAVTLSKNPEILKTLAFHPNLWVALNEQPKFFMKLLTKPDVLLAFLADDGSRKALEIVLGNPTLQQMY